MTVCHGIYVMANIFVLPFSFSLIFYFYFITLHWWFLPFPTLGSVSILCGMKRGTKQIGKWEEMWIVCPKWFSYSILFSLSPEHGLGAFHSEVRLVLLCLIKHFKRECSWAIDDQAQSSWELQSFLSLCQGWVKSSDIWERRHGWILLHLHSPLAMPRSVVGILIMLSVEWTK